MIFTMLTTLWSTFKVHEMQATRRRNQSEQIKAMWRVEDAHFNPKMNSNYMMQPDADSFVGGINMTSSKDDKNRQNLRRILKVME